MNNAATNFESKIDEMKSEAQNKNGGRNNGLSFEITNSKIQYRQEIIGQSIGGLNIYQITLTKRKEAGSIKHRKK